MTDQQFIELLRSRQAELQRLFSRTLPIKVGALAKAHFQQNFRLGGFVNGGLQQWAPTKRQLAGGSSASGQYGPLLSGRNRLMSSIAYRTAPLEATIYTSVPYAAIHNVGGIVSPSVSAKMRRFAWAMYYRNKGSNAGETPEARRWKALALTRKQKLSIRIPRRQFMGESRELAAAVSAKVSAEISSILTPNS